jgi:hypothetical protein
MRTRILGASLVGFSIVAILILHALVMAPPVDHPATTGELLLALLIVITGLPGAGMLVEGPSIFGYSDRPRPH